MKWELVDEWRSAWRWISVNCMVLAAALQGAWMNLPDDMKAALPQNAVHWSSLALLVLGVAGRVTQQGPKP